MWFEACRVTVDSVLNKLENRMRSSIGDRCRRATASALAVALGLMRASLAPQSDEFAEHNGCLSVIATDEALEMVQP